MHNGFRYPEKSRIASGHNSGIGVRIRASEMLFSTALANDFTILICPDPYLPRRQNCDHVRNTIDFQDYEAPIPHFTPYFCL